MYKILIIALADYYMYFLILLHICKYNNFKYNNVLYCLSLLSNNYKLINWVFFDIKDNQLWFNYLFS